MRAFLKKIDEKSIKAGLYLESFLSSRTFLLFLGLGLLTLGLEDLSQANVTATLPKITEIDESKFQFARCRFLYLLEGSFGALLATAAGIGAIIAAAVGKYAASYAFLIVAVSAFCLRSFISLFFGDVGKECGEGFFKN